MAEFRQAYYLKVVWDQILCGKLVSHASFESRSPKFDRLKVWHFWWFLPFLNWAYFGLRGSNEACNTIFPLRKWCLTTFGEEVWRNSAKWRFWRFFGATLATFCPRGTPIMRELISNHFPVGIWQFAIGGDSCTFLPHLQDPLNTRGLCWLLTAQRSHL